MTNGHLFDVETYGRLARAARIIAGFDRVEDAAAAIVERTGLDLSARTIYAIERGEQEPSATQFVALTVVFSPPGGMAYWRSALRDDVLAYLDRARRGSP